jgi:alpha-D-xyloside xylohydrolase
MTLVPRSDFKNGDVHALDDRRVYEVYPGSEANSITDFENRKISHSSGRLEIDGAPARITIRWRFVHPSAVTLNGHQEPNVAVSGDTSSVEFEHRGASTLTWR